MSEETNEKKEAQVAEHVPLILYPCEKAHDAEQHRYTDEDGACDDGVN